MLRPLGSITMRASFMKLKTSENTQKLAKMAKQKAIETQDQPNWVGGGGVTATDIDTATKQKRHKKKTNTKQN